MRRTVQQSTIDAVTTTAPTGDHTGYFNLTSPPSTITTTTKKPFRQDVIVIMLLASLSIAGYCYLLSLRGGTFQWVKDHVVELGTMLMISVFTFIITFNLILFLPQLSRRVRLFCIPIWLSFLALVYMWDHDDGMDYHGYFNFVALMIIFGYTQLVITIIYIFLKIWMPIPKRMKMACLTLFLMLFLVGTLKFGMWYGRRVITFRKGLFGQSMVPASESTSVCHLDDTPVAWLDIIPPYVQNFWMGQWFGCSATYQTPEIKFIENGADVKMEIYCPYSSDVHVQIIPDSIGWKYMEKRKMQHTMLQRIEQRKLKCHSRQRPAVLDLNEKGVYPYESFRVSCAKQFVERHSKIVFYPRRKSEVVKRVQSISEAKTTDQKQQQQPNVLALFLDAVSRKHFQRKFPKTIKVMEEMQKEHMTNTDSQKSTSEIFQFFRYHSVDFSTDDNTRAMWTGRTKLSSHPDEIKNVFANATVRPPLWHTFRDHGYVTLRLDDFCEDWPAKYNEYIAEQDHEVITPFCLPEYLKVNGANDLIDGPYGIRHRCLSGRFVHTYTFDYLDKFWDVYSDIPKFAVSAYIEGHELTGEIIQDVDADLAKFLRHMKNSGRLQNTILLLLSDHGLHCGLLPIMTESGKVEHMNPLQFWFIPKHILDKNEGIGMRKNLIQNSQRLVTAFDIHETLKHILNLTHVPTYKDNELPYGRSLFTDKISPTRTCSDARIPLRYCKCLPKA